MAHQQAYFTTKRIQCKFTSNIPQPFSLQKTMHVSICLREIGKKLIYFLFSKKKICTIKKGSLRWTIPKAMRGAVCQWLIVKKINFL